MPVAKPPNDSQDRYNVCSAVSSQTSLACTGYSPAQQDLYHALPSWLSHTLGTEELASKVPPTSQLEVLINHWLRVPADKYYKMLNVTK